MTAERAPFAFCPTESGIMGGSKSCKLKPAHSWQSLGGLLGECAFKEVAKKLIFKSTQHAPKSVWWNHTHRPVDIKYLTPARDAFWRWLLTFRGVGEWAGGQKQIRFLSWSKTKYLPALSKYQTHFSRPKKDTRELELLRQAKATFIFLLCMHTTIDGWGSTHLQRLSHINSFIFNPQ